MLLNHEFHNSNDTGIGLLDIGYGALPDTDNTTLGVREIHVCPG